jgi:acyl-CoA hydrolase
MPKTVALEELDLIDYIRPGDTITWGQAAAEPLALTTALVEQRARLGGVNAFVGISWYDTVSPAYCDHIAYRSYCGTGNNRLIASVGKLDILPVHYSSFERSLSGVVDVLFLQLAPGRAPGKLSFGLACEYLWPLIQTARVVITEINSELPATPSSFEISPEDIDIVVHTSRKPMAPAAAEPDALQSTIARNVAALIPDGATLQIGLGSLPLAILGALKSHRHLGVHTGLFMDGLTDLIEAGVIDNSRKSMDLGISVAGLIAGTDRTFDICNASNLLRLAPTSYTHALATLGRHERFAAINSALEVDVSGQANTETIGKDYVGAVGGGTDFARGAAASKDGLPIIALPAARRLRDGTLKSSIVPRLNGPASIARSDAGIVVTEYGSADLRGLGLAERAHRLLAIAHPDVRETLERDMRDHGDP